MINLLAQNQDDIFGIVSPPPGVSKYGDISESGLINFANNLFKLLIAGGGLYAFINIILAGFTFMSAAGDAKKIEQSVAKIWQSVLGLGLMAGSFVGAAVIGWIIFGDATAILSPKIYGPTP